VPEISNIPLVLLHGFAEDSSVWDQQKQYLEGKYRVLTPDLPGSGHTPLPEGETTMDTLAHAVKALLDAEGIDECVMVGHSMGGYVTLAFAELYPEKLKAMGLFHSTSYADTDEKRATRRKGIAFILKNGSAAFIRQSAPNLFSASSQQQHPEWISALIERYEGFSPDALISYYEAMISRPDRSHVLQQFPRPVLFILGAQDNAIPLATGLQQCHMPSVSYIHVLVNAGHMGMMEDADHANHILEEFLNDRYYE
jgi:pimeloyl-ACP methyl ester carboxylesterase